MSAIMYIGDAIETMNKLPAGSVDLLLTSPPFWKLRSYLPSDHDDKGREGGSEETPGEFIDWLIEFSEAAARVLAPHGSMAVELGDTYAGSGGAGGDYAEDGWRKGQPKFGGSATGSRESAWSIAQATWLAGVIDTEGYIGVRRQESERTSPSFSVQVRVTMMDRQVCDRAAEISGVGGVVQDGRGAFSWTVVGQQARYVLLNIWPHLLIKQRQAMAAIEVQRHIEEKKRRGKYERIEQEDIDYRQMIREYVAGLNGRGENRGVYEPTWEPPTPPMLHPPALGHLDAMPMAKSLSLIPELFRFSLVYGFNPLTGRQTDRWRLRNVVRWVRPNPPVGALGDKFRPATSELMVFCKSAKRYFDLDAVREPHKTGDHHFKYPDTNYQNYDTGMRGDDGKFRATTPNPAGAPPLDYWNIPLVEGEEATRYGPGEKSNTHRRNAKGVEARPNTVPSAKRDGGNWSTLPIIDAAHPLGSPPLDWWEIPPGGYEGSHYAVFPLELCVRPVKAMSPERVCKVCGEPSRRMVGEAEYVLENGSTATRNTWTSGMAEGKGAHSGKPDRGHRSRSAPTLGWTDCGHDDWRPGLILDPFGGSGTVAAVATGHGRDCILIDLDERNFDLALGRVGPFMLTLGNIDD